MEPTPPGNVSEAALEILDLALVPGGAPPVYAIGMVASRITMADQQRRAINIVWALLREERVKQDEKIAIIGAGIAGVTAAAYAQRKGLRVALFEKFDDPFTLQQGSGRWVHPNIYDWPAGAWEQDTTDLPCMNWSAGTARDVVATLRAEWTNLCDEFEIEWHPMTETTALEADGVAATLVDSSGKRHGPYACVIMAAGFGEEPERPEFGGKPYWRDDDIHQRLRAGGSAFVSGCGDGGLIDAIRLALRDFRHDWLSSVASATASDRKFISELLRIERDTPAFPDGDALTRATLALKAPHSVTSKIKAQLRNNTTIILNSELDGPFTRAACLINRFVVAELMKLDVITFQTGKVELSEIKRVGQRFDVPFLGSHCVVDVVVVRHGPQLRPLERFAAIDTALNPARMFLRTYRGGVDRTRAVAWAPLPNEVELPPLSSDTMAFLAQVIQSTAKDGFARRGILGVIVSASIIGPRMVDITVRIATREEHLRVHFVSGLDVTITDTQRSRTLRANLATDVMTDSKAAVPVLAAKVSEMLRWILEDQP